MLSEGIAPFSKLKTASAILQRFVREKLNANDFLDKMEIDHLQQLLSDFSEAIKPFEEVKIIEKNMEEVAMTTPVVEEETKISLQAADSQVKNGVKANETKPEKLLARPGFSICVKVNRPGSGKDQKKPMPDEAAVETLSSATDVASTEAATKEEVKIVEEVKESDTSLVGEIIEVIPSGG